MRHLGTSFFVRYVCYLAIALFLAACSASMLADTGDEAGSDVAGPDGGNSPAPVDKDSGTGGDDTGVDANSAPTVRVLFIGNSYTAANDLPAVVARLSQASQSPMRFEVEQHAPGGQTWEGHNADPALDQLLRRSWDYVVLQDQSQQAWLTGGVKAALRSLDAKIYAAGAKTVLFMTWARTPLAIDESTPRFIQDMAVNLYYEWGAEAIGARVAPVGRAWERALRDPATILHVNDGSHPNGHGTYLTACVLYATLTGRSPVGLGDGGLAVSAEDATRLQHVAEDTVAARKPPAARLLGDWPLASATSGSDIVLSDGIVLGDAVGPGAGLSKGTRFGGGRYAATPYFNGINSAHVTVSFYASRDDWSAAFAPIPPEQYMVSKSHGYEIYQSGATLYARVHTGDGETPPPIHYDAARLAPGWHHIVLTYDGTTYALWIDRIRVASGTTSGDLSYYDFNYSGHQGIAIGRRPSILPQSISDDDDSPFTGVLAGLRVYDTALTAAEIEAL